MHFVYRSFQIVWLTYGHEKNSFNYDRHWNTLYENRKRRPCLILDVNNDDDRFLVVPGTRQENENAILIAKDEKNGLEENTYFLVQDAEWVDVVGDASEIINDVERKKFDDIDITKLGHDSPYFSHEEKGWIFGKRKIRFPDIVSIDGKIGIVMSNRNSCLMIVYLDENLDAKDRLKLCPNKRNNLTTEMSIPLYFKQEKKSEIHAKWVGALNRKNKRIVEEKLGLFFK